MIPFDIFRQFFASAVQEAKEAAEDAEAARNSQTLKDFSATAEDVGTGFG